MDILLDDQEVQIKEAASEFLAGECSSALVRKIETDTLQYSPELWTKFAENGWLQLCLSEKNGGEALPLTYLGLLFELVGYHIAPIPLHATMVPAMVIDRHGSPEQQQLLQGVLSGELILSHAVAERNGRWTTDSIVLDGRIQGNELVLNGVKSFVGSFRASQLCLVLYRDAQAPHNLGAVLVPTNAQGLSSEALVSMAKDGEANLKFDNVRVPLNARIGQSADGNTIAHEVMDLSAVLYASMMAGAGQRTLDMAVAHAKQREAFGQPIGAFQAIQHLCANMVNAIDGTTMLSREALWRMDQQLPFRVNVAQAKSFGNEQCMMVVRSAQQIHGGMGFIRDFDLNLWYRRVASWSLRGGTAAEHRRTIAAALLDQPGKVRIGAIPQQ
ncbi:MAG: acyl-CoA dehydrogenase family protein [Burkholderiales bacterium]|nr:acyl-CoA dehydrogenase family protein [Burkholderiales bacterium]